MNKQPQTKEQKNSKIKDKSCDTGDTSKSQGEKAGACSDKEYETKGSNPAKDNNPAKNFKETGSAPLK